MMTVYGDDEHELEDEETAPLPGEPDMSGDDVLHYYLGGPLAEDAKDPS